MTGRDPYEEHRSSTPLELLFDLCYVVAVSQAASTLAHDLMAGHIRHGVVGYAASFFAVWWAWVNFTWFASAYDTDDVPYRLLTLLQIAGVLVLAAGVPDGFEGDFGVMVVGYVIMRVALVGQWLRAAGADPAHRQTARRYAAGVAGLQVLWILFLLVPSGARLAVFGVLVAAELLVPYWAEKSGFTPWHPGHIAERYGLFTIIVLGECILGATVAIQQAADRGVSADLLGVAFGGILLVLGIWWIYFREPFEGSLNQEPGVSFPFGYAHYFVFGSIAALGAGLELAADAGSGHVVLSDVGVGLAVAVPVIVFLLALSVIEVVVGSRSDHHPNRLVLAVVALLALGLLAGRLGPALSVALMGVVLLVDVVTKEIAEATGLLDL